MTSPGELDRSLAARAAYKIEVYPTIQAAAEAPAEEEKPSSMRRDAPIFEPRAAAVAAGEEASPDKEIEEALVLQHPPSRPEEEAPLHPEEEAEIEMLTPEQHIPVPDIPELSPSQDWCPSENEGEGSPRIQPSEVPEEFLADLPDAEEPEIPPEADEREQPDEPDVEHVLPKIRAPEKAKDQSSEKKKEVFGAQNLSKEAEAEEVLEGENKALRQLHEDAEGERAKDVEDGTVSSGLDLWVSQEDGSLYKHSTCSIHNLTHLPKDPNCPVCARAKMFFAPARKFSQISLK